MKDELLDLVNKNDEVIGTVWKSQAHQNPSLIHREISIAVFNKNNKILLQQRSLNKSHPGCWRMTATGHIGNGEIPVNAAKRELQEELGLKVEPTYYKKIFKAEEKEAKFYWIFYAIVSGEPERELDYSEVMDSKWVEINDLESFSKTHNYDLKSFSHTTIMEIYSQKISNDNK